MGLQMDRDDCSFLHDLAQKQAHDRAVANQRRIELTMQEHNHEMYMGSKYKDLMAPVQLDENALQNQLIGQIIPHI